MTILITILQKNKQQAIQIQIIANIVKIQCANLAYVRQDLHSRHKNDITEHIVFMSPCYWPDKGASMW